jgi:hypothetical protein
MNAFESACQGLGLALAAGALLGALARGGSLDDVLYALSAVAGAVAFALSLSGNDHTAWPGIPAGLAAGALGYSVSSAVASGAIERAKSGAGGAEGSPVAISGTIALVALAIAALSTLVPPASIAFVLAFAWLALARRRRAGRKYEGLRVLR